MRAQSTGVASSCPNDPQACGPRVPGHPGQVSRAPGVLESSVSLPHNCPRNFALRAPIVQGMGLTVSFASAMHGMLFGPPCGAHTLA